MTPQREPNLYERVSQAVTDSSRTRLSRFYDSVMGIAASQMLGGDMKGDAHSNTPSCPDHVTLFASLLRQTYQRANPASFGTTIIKDIHWIESQLRADPTTHRQAIYAFRTLDKDVHFIMLALDATSAELWRMPVYRFRSDFEYASRKLYEAYGLLAEEVDRFSDARLNERECDYDSLVLALGAVARAAYFLAGRREMFTWRERCERYLHGTYRNLGARVRGRRIWGSTRHPSPPGGFRSLIQKGLDPDRSYVEQYRDTFERMHDSARRIEELLNSDSTTERQEGGVLARYGVRDLQEGIWGSLRAFSLASTADIADFVAGTSMLRQPFSYDRVVAIARRGVVLGTTLAFAFRKHLTILVLSPSFDIYPSFCCHDRVLLFDDQIESGFALYAARQELAQTGVKVPLRRCMSAVRHDARSDIARTDEGEAPDGSEFCLARVDAFATTSELEKHREVHSLGVYHLDASRNTTSNSDFVQLTVDVSRNLHGSRRAVRVEESLSEKLSALHAKFEEKDYLGGLRKRLERVCFSKRRRFFKQALLIEDIGLQAEMARYFYWKVVVPAQLDVIIASSRLSVPVATILCLLSKFYAEETGQRPLSLCIAADGGLHISGLSDTLSSFASEGRSPKIGSLALGVATGNRQQRIGETIRTISGLVENPLFSDLDCESIMTVWDWNHERTWQPNCPLMSISGPLSLRAD